MTDPGSVLGTGSPQSWLRLAGVWLCLAPILGGARIGLGAGCIGLGLAGLHPEDENVYLLNPYDERGVVWDLAEGAQGPLLARHLAALLVPPEHMSTAPYFPDSARDLLYAVILALNQVAGSHWQFRDLHRKNLRTISAGVAMTGTATSKAWSSTLKRS